MEYVSTITVNIYGILNKLGLAMPRTFAAFSCPTTSHLLDLPCFYIRLQNRVGCRPSCFHFLSEGQVRQGGGVGSHPVRCQSSFIFRPFSCDMFPVAVVDTIFASHLGDIIWYVISRAFASRILLFAKKIQFSVRSLFRLSNMLQF